MTRSIRSAAPFRAERSPPAPAKHPTRLKWLASLPWDFASEAVAELRRAKDGGAVGICMLTNIVGTALTDARYQPVWAEVEGTGLPVFIHPTLPKVDYGLMYPSGGGALRQPTSRAIISRLAAARRPSLSRWGLAA